MVSKSKLYLFLLQQFLIIVCVLVGMRALLAGDGRRAGGCLVLVGMRALLAGDDRREGGCLELTELFLVSITDCTALNLLPNFLPDRLYGDTLGGCGGRRSGIHCDISAKWSSSDRLSFPLPSNTDGVKFCYQYCIMS